MKKLIMVSCIVFVGLLSNELLADGWGNATLHKEARLTIADKTITGFVVDVGAGDLRIKGYQEQSDIVVIANVFGDELNAEDYVLSLEKVDNKAMLMAHFKGNTHNNERIDLEISMPYSLSLSVDDRSGDILIESIGNGLTLKDRSGDIEMNSITGPIKIEDRSGDVIGEDLNGNVVIFDRSGDIQLKDITGDLDIDDSSGDIRVKSVSGIVTVEDSSGDINVKDAGDFVLKNDGSGEVYLKNIRKNLK